MIVRKQQDQLILITQPEHARLSAELMSWWRRDGFPGHPRRDVILLATREHDGGWAELDEAPLVDERTGRLLDFIQAPDHVRQSVWPRGVERLADDPYAAALVAQHALTIYKDNRPTPAWASFFAQMEDLRAHFLSAAAPLTLDDLARDYLFVCMGDMVSLFFANHWPGPRTEGQYAVRATIDRILIDPDPFEGARLPVSLRGRLLAGGAYSSAAGAKAAFDAAATITLNATASGS